MKLVIMAIVSLSIGVLSGCKEKDIALTNKTTFSGSLTQPTSPIYIELESISRFKYAQETKTGSNISTQLFEESYTRENSKFIKALKTDMNGQKFKMEVEILPNGIITSELTLESIAKSLGTTSVGLPGSEKRAALELLLAVHGAGNRFPEFELGLKITPGFESNCWKWDAYHEAILRLIFKKQLNVANSQLVTDSDSNCSFAGITTVNLRKAAVFNVYGHSTLKQKGKSKIGDYIYTGWRAVDLEKGVVVETLINTTLKVNGRPVPQFDITLRRTTLELR